MRHRNFPPPFAEWNLPRSRAVYPDDDVRRLWRDAPRSTELPQVGLAHLVPPVRARRLRERDLRRKPGHDGLRAEAVLPLSVRIVKIPNLRSFSNLQINPLGTRPSSCRRSRWRAISSGRTCTRSRSRSCWCGFCATWRSGGR
uniref:(northern house mosquito) hypothetical protein n=1 Tax=Culex pipiens TaxID=7175 RepID=A0A8D8C138_CULPI